MKSHVDFAHLFEAAQQQARSGEQYERNGEFGDDQNGPQSCVVAAGAACPPTLFERVIHACPRSRVGRQQSTQQPGEERDSDGKKHHLPVKSDCVDTRKRFGQKPDAGAQQTERERKAREPSHDTEH